MAGAFGPEPFLWLCPVHVESTGIMEYFVRPSGPSLEPMSTKPLPPGNYGWFLDEACIAHGLPRMMMMREHFFTFEARFSEEWPEGTRLVMNTIAPTVKSQVVVRGANRCCLTGATADVETIWIIPPAVSWLTDDFADGEDWDDSPFMVAENVLLMHRKLAHFFLCNHFAIDIDDGYRICKLCPMDGAEQLLPTHLPKQHHDPSTDHYLRLHFRFSISLVIRGGDISEVYPSSFILATMQELKVNEEDADMIPLTDHRWHTPLGKAIFAFVRPGHSLSVQARRTRHREDISSSEGSQ
ncbi:hypothetical protein B0H19DRAFT_1169238 [Mycena capillaripes]|nr:hypothetical protein B0H19DRAFT_1169238 [Mycena capillaripes]